MTHTISSDSASGATGLATAELSARPFESLSFRLGNEEYGIDILKVQEIRGYERSTRMVGAAEFVKGVMNLRGVIVPIIDLRMKFEMPEVHYNSMTVTVILKLDRRVVGVVVDAVSDVVEITPAQIKPVPAFSGPVDASCVTGICSVPVEGQGPDRMLILLDVERLLSDTTMGIAPQTLQ